MLDFIVKLINITHLHEDAIFFKLWPVSEDRRDVALDNLWLKGVVTNIGSYNGESLLPLLFWIIASNTAFGFTMHLLWIWSSNNVSLKI